MDNDDLIRRGDVIAIAERAELVCAIPSWMLEYLRTIPAASQPADPVTNAGSCQQAKVKPLEWQAFANISAAPDDDATMDDNLAVALCSYFDCRMDCPDDGEDGAELDEYDCWKVWVSENAEKVLRRIAKAANDHILAALEAAPRVNETQKSEHDRADVLTALPAAVTLAEALQVPEVRAMVEALRELLIAADGESYAQYFSALEAAAVALRAIEEGEA